MPHHRFRRQNCNKNNRWTLSYILLGMPEWWCCHSKISLYNSRRERSADEDESKHNQSIREGFNKGTVATSSCFVVDCKSDFYIIAFLMGHNTFRARSMSLLVPVCFPDEAGMSEPKSIQLLLTFFFTVFSFFHLYLHNTLTLSPYQCCFFSIVPYLGYFSLFSTFAWVSHPWETRVFSRPHFSRLDGSALTLRQEFWADICDSCYILSGLCCSGGCLSSPSPLFLKIWRQLWVGPGWWLAFLP